MHYGPTDEASYRDAWTHLISSKELSRIFQIIDEDEKQDWTQEREWDDGKQKGRQDAGEVEREAVGKQEEGWALEKQEGGETRECREKTKCERCAICKQLTKADTEQT